MTDTFHGRSRESLIEEIRELKKANSVLECRLQHAQEDSRRFRLMWADNLPVVQNKELALVRGLLKNLNDKVWEADARIIWEHHMSGNTFAEAIEEAMFDATAYLKALEPKP